MAEVGERLYCRIRSYLRVSILESWKLGNAVWLIGYSWRNSTCASSMASSTYAGIEESFNISNEVAILTVSLFVMGLGIGPLLVGPVSEFIGRRAVYLWSYIAFLREFPSSTVSLRLPNPHCPQ
jgi:MFS family permease